MVRGLLWFLLLFGTSAIAEGGKYSSPNLVSKAIDRSGARVVLEEVYDTSAWSIWVMPGISSGAPEWIMVGEKLRIAADAGASEDLSKAYAVALVRNPRYMLPILKSNWWEGKKACKFGWDSELPGGVQSYLEELRAAVQSATAVPLALRTECLEGVRESSEEFRLNAPKQ